MSYIGNKPIKIPEQISFVQIKKNTKIDTLFLECESIKGKQIIKLSSILTYKFSPDQKKLYLLPVKTIKKDKIYSYNKIASFRGSEYTRINQFFINSIEGFRRQLGLVGIGYRIIVNKDTIERKLGRSHDVIIPIPEGIEIKIPKYTIMSIYGKNPKQVWDFVSKLRKYRLPEPYKGKGLKYRGEFIRIKKIKKV